MMTTPAQPAPLQNEDLLDAVRAGFAWVAQRARHVRIHEERLADYARALPNQPPVNLYDPDHHLIGTAEETAAYSLTLSAINFGSGFKDDLVAEGWPLIDNSIYYSIATPLKKYIRTVGLISAADMAKTKPETVEAMLSLPRGTPEAEKFSRLCAENLREFGVYITDAHSGSFLEFIRAAQGSAERLASMLARLPSYADVHDYHGTMVSFYKRAQIAAGDLQLAFGKLGETLFNDIHRLTMFPDNGVPHVLRIDGILEYDAVLAARIDAGHEIASGSDEEIEIRACAGQAVEYLAALKGKAATDIDYLLWHRSVEGGRYQSLPAHRTKTVFY